MAYYSLPANNKNGTRTINYQFSVNSKNDADLLTLKENIARKNKEVREGVRNGTKKLWSYHDQPHGWRLQRVRLMARGSRRGIKAYIDEATGTIRAKKVAVHSNADCCLQHKYATHFDVYVEDDLWNMDILRTEMETGQTASQQAAIRKAQTDVVMAQVAIYEELREKHGIIARGIPGGKTEFTTVEQEVVSMRERGVREEIIQRIYPDSAT